MLDHNLRCAEKPQKRQPGLEAQWVPLPAPETRVMLPASPGGTNGAANEPSASEIDGRCCRKPFLTTLPGTYSCWHHTGAGPMEPETCQATHCRCRSPRYGCRSSTEGKSCTAAHCACRSQAGSPLWVHQRAVPSSCGCSSPAWPHSTAAGAHTSPAAPATEGKGHMGTRWPVAANGVTLTRLRI